MKQCKSIGCSSLVSTGSDRCIDCQHQDTLDTPSTSITANTSNSPIRYLTGDEGKAVRQQVASGHSVGSVEDTSSGGDNDYWIAKITHPKRLEPYEAECEDLIEHFQMTFQEGESFKALWRKGQARIGNGKPGDSPLRNAQKVRHYGARMEVMEERQLETAD